MKHVLVTGAAGFIGRHLVKKLLEQGCGVRALVRMENDSAAELREWGVEIITGGITDEKAVAEAVRGVDIIHHLAGVVSDWGPHDTFHRVNVGGMKLLCEAALKAGVQLLVNTSTSDAFGLREDRVIEESLEYRGWNEPYPDTKIEAAHVAWDYHRKGLPVTMLYPCWVYGPGDRTFLPLTADAVKKKELIFWRKNPIIWPAYIDNLIDLMWLVSVDPRAVGEGFIVHDGEMDTFENFTAKIATQIGAPAPKLHIPYGAAMSAAWVMEHTWKLLRKELRPLLTIYTVKQLGSRMRFSIKKAEDLLGWTPPVSYAEGMEKGLEWLQTQDVETLKIK